MPSELRAETAQLVSDYLQYHWGSQALPPNQIAKTLWRVADELESREKMLFHMICNPAALPKPGKVAVHLSRVAAQMEVDSDLNWGRVVVLVVFTGNLADVLAEWGAHEETDTLAEALVTYLAGEKCMWLEAQGGWEGICRFFNKRGPESFGSQVPKQSGAAGVATSQAWITDRSKECKDYLLPEDDEEEDEVEQHLDTLKKAQRKFHRDLEEVIRAILDMVA
ncbi:UNVERIFIED_CONTAM: hypothetical protein K2H54_004917 [Gekko kuhli]